MKQLRSIALLLLVQFNTGLVNAQDGLPQPLLRQLPSENGNTVFKLDLVTNPGSRFQNDYAGISQVWSSYKGDRIVGKHFNKGQYGFERSDSLFFWDLNTGQNLGLSAKGDLDSYRNEELLAGFKAGEKEAYYSFMIDADPDEKVIILKEKVTDNEYKIKYDSRWYHTNPVFLLQRDEVRNGLDDFRDKYKGKYCYIDFESKSLYLFDVERKGNGDEFATTLYRCNFENGKIEKLFDDSYSLNNGYTNTKDRFINGYFIHQVEGPTSFIKIIPLKGKNRPIFASLSGDADYVFKKYTKFEFITGDTLVFSSKNSLYYVSLKNPGQPIAQYNFTFSDHTAYPEFFFNSNGTSFGICYNNADDTKGVTVVNTANKNYYGLQKIEGKQEIKEDDYLVGASDAVKGSHFYGLQNYEKAIEFFSKDIAANPNNAESYYYRGDSYFKISAETPNAGIDFKKYVSLSPNEERGHVRLSEYYMTIGDTLGFLQEVTNILRILPSGSAYTYYSSYKYKVNAAYEAAHKPVERVAENNKGNQLGNVMPPSAWTCPKCGGAGTILVKTFMQAEQRTKIYTFSDGSTSGGDRPWSWQYVGQTCQRCNGSGKIK